MKHFLLLTFTLGLCIYLGGCLECYTCLLSINRCITNPKNCTGANDKCFYRVGKAGSLSVYSAGCIAPTSCDKNFNQNFGLASVSLVTTCCDKNLCNGSSHVKSSLLLGFAMLSLWFTGFL